MPAPYLYGLVVAATETESTPSRYGMVLTFWIQIPACLFVTLSYYTKLMKEQSLEEMQKKNLLKWADCLELK